MNSEIINLRNQFREWYATLSISELIVNRRLTQRIEILEKRLSALVA